jgi:hypothetical protein
LLEVKFPYAILDPWQKEVLEAQGNIILMCGRQVGKSEVISKKIAEFLLNNNNKKILICSGVERQASGLYNKTLRLIEETQPGALKKGKDKPLRTTFKLKNGSILITEPVGLDGAGARQHTLNGVVFEEMQLIPEEAFAAITPMLLTTGGFIWMLGTAWATEGYVYDRLSDPNFKVFRINSEEVANIRPEPSRTIMLAHLEAERQRLTEAQYAQEYLAIPSSNVRQIFTDTLIKKICTAKRPGVIVERDYICGVDPAGLGEDEGSISILTYNEDRGNMKQVEHEITTKLYTTQTTQRIIDLERRYNFKKIYVDDGGIGFGVFSELLHEDDTKFKTIALNNSARPLDYKDERTKKILGNEMVFNLLVMMEKGKIELLDDAEIRESLKSYKFEYSKDRKELLISSNYNHPVQSIMRAAWHAQRKDLNLGVYSIKV